MKLSKKLKKKLKTNLIKTLFISTALCVSIATGFTLNRKTTLFSNNANETSVSGYNLADGKATLSEIYPDLGSDSQAVTPKIEGGQNHFLALTADGKVYGWGDNSNGQLATGDTTIQKKPVYMGINNAIDIATGAYFNVVLKSDGTVWTIGNNENGQLGNGTQDSSNIFVQVKTESGAELSNIKAVSAGNTFAYAITNSNEVYAWGLNASGQLGVGDTTLRTTATKTQFANIVQIEGGGNHAVALDSTGAVWGVGYNYYGQLATGNVSNKSVPVKMLASGGAEVAAGVNHTMILK